MARGGSRLTGSCRRHAARLVLLAVSLCVPAAPAWALILAPSDIDASIRPPDDPGWDSVGRRANASAVYLGDRWVLTAFHVAAGTVNLGGVNYSKEPGEGIQLQNPPGFGLSQFTDLRMFRLEEAPPLPPMRISQVRPPNGAEVTLIGYGRLRSGPRTFFTVDQTQQWVETDDPRQADYAGFHTGGSGKRWGTNRVDSARTVTTSGYDNVSLGATFDVSALEETEARAAGGDSGGGVFYKKGGTWYLTGIIQNVSTNPGQPSTIAAYGDITNFADLSLYRSQILEIMQQADAGPLSPWQNPTDALNVDADHLVSPLDVLTVVDELNNPRISDPRTGQLPPVGAFAPPPYLDVDGNGIISPLDALRVINELNRQSRVLVPKGVTRQTRLIARSVPEPSTACLFAAALLMLCPVRQRSNVGGTW